MKYNLFIIMDIYLMTNSQGANYYMRKKIRK